MGKNSAINTLFEERFEFYRSKGINTEEFSRDGIIDESLFNKADRRILFILRETNKFPGGDLREFLSQTVQWQIWRNVGRWACGISNEFPDYSECDTHQNVCEAIRQTAIMNLKKITGGSWSDLDEINETAHRDRKFILREVEIIDPEVIVACGTWGHLVWLFNLDDLPRQDKFSYTGGRLYLSTRHPVRADNQKTYKQLRALWLKAQDKGHSH